MPRGKIRTTKRTLLSQYEQSQRASFAIQFGQKIVHEIFEGVLWLVSHNPFIKATCVDAARNRWVIATYTETKPSYELVYVFTEGDDQRMINKVDIRSIEDGKKPHC